MKALRQMGGGVIIAVISLLLVIGGISLSLAETSTPPPPTPSPIPTTFAVEFASPLPATPTLIPTETATAIPDTPTSIPNITSLPPTSCPVPNGWFGIVVGANDTLYSIAQRYNTTVENLNANNCLNYVNPTPGSILYVPPGPTAVVVQCSPPAGWVKRHVVQPGENLYRIALSYGITYPQLQTGNCMGSSTTIFVGQVLWVPNVPTRTPTILPTSTFNFSTPTRTSTPTLTPSLTSTFVVTSSPVPTNTTIPSPTSTFIQTATLTSFPTQNSTP